MDKFIEIIIIYLKIVLPILIISYVLHVIISRIQMKSYEVFGKPSLFLIYLTVPLHELCHLIMALLFTHKIVSVKLMQFRSEDGTIGSVTTTKSRSRFLIRKFYMNIGDYFVGIAPVLLGSLGLVYLTNYLDNKYFEKVLENPMNAFNLPILVYVIIVIFNFAMFSLSDLDMISGLKGLPYYTIFIGILVFVLQMLGYDNLITKMIFLQTNSIVILLVSVAVSIVMLVVLYVLWMIKNLLRTE